MDDLFIYITDNTRSNLPAIWNEGNYLNYQSLANLIAVVQEEIIAQEIKEGEAVILKTPKQLEFSIYFLALLLLGCWVVPLDPNTSEKDLQKTISITNGKEININLELFAKSHNLGKMTHRKVHHCIKEGGIYHRSSGSTGGIKFCVRPTSHLLEEGRMYSHVLSLGEDDKVLSMAPFFHSFALGSALITSVVAGACLYTLNQLNFHKVLQIMDENKVTILIGVPALVRLLIQTDKNSTYDFSKLRCVLVGAGELTREICHDFYERFKIHLSSNYGSTETGGIITRTGHEPFGSVGKCHSGVQFKICDEEKRQVSKGSIGELYVRCGCMFTHYLNQEKDPFDNDGFFATGDIAICDSEQNIFIKGRKKLIANIGGKKYNIEEIEKIIMQYEQIEDAAVTSSQNEKGEEILIAYIVSSKALSGIALRKYCANHIGSSAIITHLYQVEALPKNDYGKLLRTQLNTTKIMREIDG